MSEPLLSVEEVSIHFGGIVAVDKVSLKARAGAVTAVIGPNGAGKTTLFNIVTGFYRPDSGSVRFDGQEVTSKPLHRLAGIGMSRTFQNLRIFDEMTALENVMVGFHLHRRSSVLGGLLGLPFMHRERRRFAAEAQALLDRVGLGGSGGRRAGALSYGQMKRLEIARALATQPKMLLLDEPAAGCNAVETGEIEALIRQLRDEGLCLVLVEHDMEMLMAVSDYVYVLESGRRIAEGTPQEITHNPRVIEAYLGAGADQQIEELHHA